MSFIETSQPAWRAAWKPIIVVPVCATAAWLAGCSTPMPPDARSPAVLPPAQAPSGTARPAAKLAHSWTEYRFLAAQRLVDANPGITYMGDVPEPLLAIPVIEVELNADGSIRQINVLRHPSQAEDTVQIAIDALRRAAPFGDVTHLPKPWKMSEVFLFDGARHFKPRTLDN